MKIDGSIKRHEGSIQVFLDQGFPREDLSRRLAEATSKVKLCGGKLNLFSASKNHTQRKINL